MKTYVMTKKFFLKQIDELIDKQFIIFSNIIQGEVSGASKKRLKSFQVGFTSDCFKKPDMISDLLNSSCWGLILMDKKHIPKETIKAVLEGEIKYASGGEEGK